MKKISIIIATKNRPHLLKESLSSIISNTILPDEMIVVDQGDGSMAGDIVEALKINYKNLLYFKDSRVGKSKALNFGIRKSRGDIIGFTDDDCIVSKEWISSFRAEAESSPDFSAITGRTLAEQGFETKEFLNLVRSEKRKEAVARKNPWKIGCSGCNMFIKKEFLVNIDYFDEDFGSGARFKAADDGDIIYRILRAKGKVIYSPRVIVYHKAWREREDNIRLRSNYAFSLGAFAGKYLFMGDVYPCWFVFCKFLQKARRLAIGFLVFDKNRISDGYSHLKGIAIGFLKILLYNFKNGRKNISNYLYKK